MCSSSGRLFVHAVLYGLFFMHLCKQSSRRKDVLAVIKHILPPARFCAFCWFTLRNSVGSVCCSSLTSICLGSLESIFFTSDC